MSAFLARNRPILLAYAGMVVLLLVTALFSPGFLARLQPALDRSSSPPSSASSRFGQTFVIIGGGIDLSIPWVLNSAAVLMTLLCGGQDAAAPLGLPAPSRRRRRRRPRQRHRRRPLRRAADHHDPRGQRDPAGPDPRQYRRLAHRRRPRRHQVPRRRPHRRPAGDRPPLARAGAPRHAAPLPHRLRPPPLRPRHQPHRGRVLRRPDRPHDDPHLRHLRPHRRARRHAPHRLFRPGLSRHGRPLPLHLRRRGRHRRRLDPRRQRPLCRHRRRRARPHHPHRPPARPEPLQRRPPHRLRRRHPRSPSSLGSDALSDLAARRRRKPGD